MAPLTRIALAAAAALALCASLSAAFLLGAAVAAAPAGAITASAPRPPITVKLIPFGATRKAQMADYSRRHYRQHTWKLTAPKAIVLHHTAGATWQPAWWTFVNNTAYASIPGTPEKPGVSAHFIIGKDGTIYQCVPLSVRARADLFLVLQPETRTSAGKSPPDAKAFRRLHLQENRHGPTGAVRLRRDPETGRFGQPGKPGDRTGPGASPLPNP